MSSWFSDAFGGAVDDIRAKLIDEAWFSRRPPSPQTPSHHDRSTTDEPERQPEDRGQAHGIDR